MIWKPKSLPISALSWSLRFAKACQLFSVRRFFGLVLLAAAILPSFGEESRELVVPPGSSSRPGSTSSDIPFIGNGLYLQTVYHRSLFEPVEQYITAIKFRAEEGLSQDFDATYGRIDLFLATFPHPMETLSVVFDPVLYSDATLVYSPENVRLRAAGSTSAEVPAPFEIELRFDRPFYYNPSAGNLLMFLQIGADLNGRGRIVDAEDLVRPPYAYSIIGPHTGPNPAFAGPGSLVTKFAYTVIPEPRTVCLTTLSLIIIYGVKYGHYRRNY